MGEGKVFKNEKKGIVVDEKYLIIFLEIRWLLYEIKSMVSDIIRFEEIRLKVKEEV